MFKVVRKLRSRDYVICNHIITWHLVFFICHFSIFLFFFAKKGFYLAIWRASSTAYPYLTVTTKLLNIRHEGERMAMRWYCLQIKRTIHMKCLCWLCVAVVDRCLGFYSRPWSLVVRIIIVVPINDLMLELVTVDSSTYTAEVQNVWKTPYSLKISFKIINKLLILRR